MSLEVVGMSNQDGKAVVTIQSDKDGTGKNSFSLAITELGNAEARRLAVQHATTTGGIAGARVEFPGAPYPVDETGEVVTRPHEQTIHRYRVDIPVTQGMR